MNVVIVGTSHHIQLRKDTCFGSAAEELERDQKQRFWNWIRDLIVQNNLQAVAEESKHGEFSIAENVARDINVSYRNVEMLPEDRKRRGIPPDYRNGDFTPEQKQVWDTEREAFMYEQALEFSAARDLLVVCGSLHASPLTERFRSDGHSVVTDDLRNQSWYVEDWIEHVNRLPWSGW